MNYSVYTPPTQSEVEVQTHQYEIGDQFASAEGMRAIDEKIAALTELGYRGDTSVGLRARNRRIDMDNPATQALCEQVPTFREWLTLVPSAAALEPLYKPNLEHLPDAYNTPVSPEFRQWLYHGLDARAMRNRTEIVSTILANDAESIHAPSKWLSIAGGAAYSVVNAVHRVRDAGSPAPQVTLIDKDPRTLALAQNYAAQLECADTITTLQADILNAETFSDLANTAQFDLVEAVGITEYLDGDTLKTFLERAFQQVKPGGVLVVGNMLDTHPQLGFTLNVVQWPYIVPRSFETMQAILRDSISASETTSAVHVSDDRVYALYTVRKPYDRSV